MPRPASPINIDAPAPDLRFTQTWGIEDSTNGCAGLVIGHVKVAEREAFKLCEYRNAPVTVYWVDGGDWREYARVRV